MASIDETVRRTKERSERARQTVDIVPADSLTPIGKTPGVIRVRGSSVKTLTDDPSEELVDIEIEPKYESVLPFASHDSGAIRVIDKQWQLDLRNSASEQTLYSYIVPGGTVALGSALRFSMSGFWDRNEATGNRLFVLRMYWGGTQFYEDTSLNPGSSALEIPWRMFGMIVVDPDNDHTIDVGFDIENASFYPANPPGGYGGFQTDEVISNLISVNTSDTVLRPSVVNKDMTQDQEFRITIQNDQAAAEVGLVRQFAFMEVIP